MTSAKPKKTGRPSLYTEGAALQVPGVERHAARLVRVGYLPRSGDEDDAAPTRAARRQRRHRATSRLYHNRKSSVGLGMSVVGGKAEVDFGRLNVCL